MAVVINGTSGITGNTGTLISATTIGVGNATPSASGAGITFPATQSASTDANTLDDYEEGTWSPTFNSDGGTTGTQTNTLRWGRYTKIGRQVTVTFGWTGSLSGYTGTLFIGGLPFGSVADSPYNYSGTLNCSSSTATASNNSNFTFFVYLSLLYPRFTTGQSQGYLFASGTQINGLNEMEGTITYVST
jgi:hypothetical protein